MKRRVLLLSAAFAAAFSASAQVWVADSVTMGAGYANDVHYSLTNGTVQSTPNNTWTLAFQMTPQGPYGNVSIWANHVRDTVSVYSLNMKASTSFTSLTAADTVGKTSSTKALYNTDSSWNYGAFNRMQSSNPFDYSWGTYDMVSHNVNGDSLYLVKAGTSTYKLWIQQYVSSPADSVQWKFRIAKWDGSGDTTIRIYRKPGFTDDLFAYYNPRTNVVLDREPGRGTWDFIFTRYSEYITGAPGVPYYPVTGVLSNFGTLVADVRSVDDDTAQYQNYTRVKKLNEIGSDWKSFNNTTMQWSIDTGATFFIKSASSNQYWQLSFTGFVGSAGKSIFRKRALAPTAVVNVTSAVSSYTVAPNPATNTASLMLEAKENGTATILVSDMQGRVMMQRNLSLTKGLNGFAIPVSDYAAGTYLISISNGTWKAAEKLTVVH